MVRAILNAVPDWGLFLIILTVATALSLVGLVLVRRFLPHWRSDSSSAVVAGVAAMVMTLFALVLAFVVVNLYQNYQTAQANISAEADSLAQMARDAQVFPIPAEARIDRSIAHYVREVVDVEFPDLRSGTADPTATVDITAMFLAYQDYSPHSQSQIAFYSSAVDNLNGVVADRRERVVEATTSLPPVFLALLLLTALLSIATTFFFKASQPGLEVLLIAIVAIVISSGILTVILLEYPFSGSVSVSDSPFTSGALAHLIAVLPR